MTPNLMQKLLFFIQTMSVQLLEQCVQKHCLISCDLYYYGSNLKWSVNQLSACSDSIYSIF